MKKGILLGLGCLLLAALATPATAQSSCSPTCTPGESTYCSTDACPCPTTCCEGTSWQGTLVVGNKTYTGTAYLHLSGAAPYALVSIKELGLVRERYFIRKGTDGRLLFTPPGRMGTSFVSARPSRAL